MYCLPANPAAMRTQLLCLGRKVSEERKIATLPHIPYGICYGIHLPFYQIKSFVVNMLVPNMLVPLVLKVTDKTNGGIHFGTPSMNRFL